MQACISAKAQASCAHSRLLCIGVLVQGVGPTAVPQAWIPAKAQRISNTFAWAYATIWLAKPACKSKVRCAPPSRAARTRRLLRTCKPSISTCICLESWRTCPECICFTYLRLAAAASMISAFPARALVGQCARNASTQQTVCHKYHGGAKFVRERGTCLKV